MTVDQKRAQPLHYKIEALIVHLVRWCTDVLFKENFLFPVNSSANVQVRMSALAFLLFSAALFF